MTPETRQHLERAIEELIALVDMIDGDENAEDDGTAEHSLGWTERGPGAGGNSDPLDDLEDGADDEPLLGSIGDYGFTSQTNWSAGGDCDEREVENEHGGDVLDEPHDALDEGNDEYSLGWGNPWPGPWDGASIDGCEDSGGNHSGPFGKGKAIVHEMLKRNGISGHVYVPPGIDPPENLDNLIGIRECSRA